MTPGTVRALALGVCAAGTAGMIASTIAGHDGAALTFGLFTAVAVLCLVVATAVSGNPSGTGPRDSEGQAARVEAAITSLVESGVQEPAVRSLVREAVELGRLRAGPARD